MEEEALEQESGGDLGCVLGVFINVCSLMGGNWGSHFMDP